MHGRSVGAVLCVIIKVVTQPRGVVVVESAEWSRTSTMSLPGSCCKVCQGVSCQY